MTVDDLGNEGKGGAKSKTDTVDITVRPVNDPVTVTVPNEDAATTNEDTLLPFTDLRNTLVQISDDGDSQREITITIKPPTNGTLSFAPGASIVDGNIVFKGTAADVNNFLTTMGYTPNPGFVGLEPISFNVNDGLLDTPSFIKVTVKPVYHAPVNEATADRVIDPDSNTVFKKIDADGLFSIRNTDNVPLDLVIKATNGTIGLGNLPGGLQITGNDTEEVHLHGSWEDINRALEGLIYKAHKGFTGTDPVEVTLTKEGNVYPRIVFITVPMPARMGGGAAPAGSGKVFGEVTLDQPVLTDDSSFRNWGDTRSNSVPDGEYLTGLGSFENILEPRSTFYESRRVTLALGSVRDGEYANSAFSTYNTLRLGGVTDGERLMESFGSSFKNFDSRSLGFYGAKNPLFQFDWERILSAYDRMYEGQRDLAMNTQPK